MMPLLSPRRFLAVLAAGVLFATPTWAQRVAPSPPERYEIELRYRIRAGTHEHITLYRDLVRYLQSVGMQVRPPQDPSEPADPQAERLYGVIPSRALPEIFKNPLVQTALVIPAGYLFPENLEQRVLLQIALNTVAPAKRQELHIQALERLKLLGFQPKHGYDTQGYQRILGTLPVGDVEKLLTDLRLLPGGWITAEQDVEKLPDPIRNVLPIRVIEVIPEAEGLPANQDAPAPPAPPEGQEYLAKIAPDLKPALADPGKTMRLEVIFYRNPDPNDTSWRTLLQTVPGLVIEGKLGPIVSILAPAAAAIPLAQSPAISTVRPAREATRQPEPRPAGQIAPVLRDTGLQQLHDLKFRGQGIRVAIIDTDFRGVRDAIGKELPQGTGFIDLTSLRNPALDPDPDPPGSGLGRGTRMAQAVRLAAPEANLVLIRVDPAAAYQIYTVARFIHGRIVPTESIRDRFHELNAESSRLRSERLRLTTEREQLFSDYSQSEENVQKRKALLERSVALALQEKENLRRLDHFNKIDTDLATLDNVRVVVSPLAWDIGYPIDASGPLSRYLDEAFYGRPQRKIPGRPRTQPGPQIWVQAAGNTARQVWNWQLVDRDGNGAFEFAPPQVPLPPGRWSRELNFLAWQPKTGAQVVDLPAGARIRVAVQWTEAHDPLHGEGGFEDPYRKPLADIRLLVLQTRDPSGRKVASDDLNIVARGETLPQMIDRAPDWAVYEQLLDFEVKTAGQYALRLEGRVAPTIRPLGAPTMPVIERGWEPRARIFVENLDDASRAAGRVVIGDYLPQMGGLGDPGNALYPKSVGAAGARGEPRPFSAFGPPSGQELLVKPNYLAFDELPLGPGGAAAGSEIAAAFSAGMIASMMSAGIPDGGQLNWLQIPPGGMLHVPPAWLQQIMTRNPGLRERPSR